MKKRLVAFLLALSMIVSVLSSCSIEEKEDSNNGTDTSDFSDDDFTDKYINYFDSQRVKYKCESIYPDNSNVDSILNNINTTQTCDFIYDGDYSKIKDTIINNSKEYISKIDYDYENPFESNDDVDMDLVLSFILNIWNNQNASDKNDDAHVFQTLKIVFSGYSTTNLAEYFSDENLIVLDKNAIYEKSQRDGVSFAWAMIYVLSHEIFHVMQEPCPCRIQKGQKYRFAKNNYTCSTSSTLLEASAESYLYNNDTGRLAYDLKYNYTYTEERKFESELLLLNLFSENTTLSDYYKAMFNTDLESFIDCFGLESQEDILDFYKIIFSMDGLDEQTTLQYDVKFNNRLANGTTEEIIGLTYKANLFNMVLKKMVVYTNNNPDFSLEENVAMFNLVKGIITSDIDDTTETKVINSIDKSEKKYTKYLSEKYNVDVNYVNELEENDETLENIDLYLIGNNSDFIGDTETKILSRFPEITTIYYPFNYIDNDNYKKFEENILLSKN